MFAGQVLIFPKAIICYLAFFRFLYPHLSLVGSKNGDFFNMAKAAAVKLRYHQKFMLHPFFSPGEASNKRSPSVANFLSQVVPQLEVLTEEPDPNLLVPR